MAFTFSIYTQMYKIWANKMKSVIAFIIGLLILAFICKAKLVVGPLSINFTNWWFGIFIIVTFVVFFIRFDKIINYIIKLKNKIKNGK